MLQHSFEAPRRDMDLRFFGGLLGVLEWRSQHELSDLSEYSGFFFGYLQTGAYDQFLGIF